MQSPKPYTLNPQKILLASINFMIGSFMLFKFLTVQGLRFRGCTEIQLLRVLLVLSAGVQS